MGYQWDETEEAYSGISSLSIKELHDYCCGSFDQSSIHWMVQDKEGTHWTLLQEASSLISFSLLHKTWKVQYILNKFIVQYIVLIFIYWNYNIIYIYIFIFNSLIIKGNTKDNSDWYLVSPSCCKKAIIICVFLSLQIKNNGALLFLYLTSEITYQCKMLIKFCHSSGPPIPGGTSLILVTAHNVQKTHIEDRDFLSLQLSVHIRKFSQKQP